MPVGILLHTHVSVCRFSYQKNTQCSEATIEKRNKKKEKEEEEKKHTRERFIYKILDYYTRTQPK